MTPHVHIRSAYSRCEVCGEFGVYAALPLACDPDGLLNVEGKRPEPFVDDDGVELVTEEGQLTLAGAARLLGEEV